MYNKNIQKTELVGNRFHTMNPIVGSLSFGEKAQSFVGDIANISGRLLNLESFPSELITNRVGIQALDESFRVLADSVGQFQRMTIGNGLVNTIPKLDFMLDPMNTSLGLALGSIEKQRLILDSTINSFSDTFSASQNSIASLISATETVKLNNYAMNFLEDKSSLTLIPPRNNLVFSTNSLESPSEMEKLNDKIKTVENELKSLKRDRQHKGLSVLTDKVKSLLGEVSNNLLDKFDAICLVIFDDINKERIPHSAESMTRIMEDLPVLLAPETAKQSTESKKIASLCLSKYLGIELSKSHDHDLIVKQHKFYEIFSEIRHRRAKKYLEDPLLFKSLLVQAEAYIYELLTYTKQST